MICIANLKGWERISKITRIPGVTYFESSKGWDYFHNEWYKKLCENLENYVYGIRNCYPDTVIYDLIEWSGEKRQRELQQVNIPYVGIYDEARPTYSFFSEHEYNPDIQENIKQAGNILESFYESEWHKRIENKIAFHKYKCTESFDELVLSSLFDSVYIN